MRNGKDERYHRSQARAGPHLSLGVSYIAAPATAFVWIVA